MTAQVLDKAIIMRLQLKLWIATLEAAADWHELKSTPFSANYYATYINRVGQKRGHLVSQVVTLEIFTKTAPNLVEINLIAFWTLTR